MLAVAILQQKQRPLPCTCLVCTARCMGGRPISMFTGGMPMKHSSQRPLPCPLSALGAPPGCLYKWEVGTLVPTSPDVAARPTYVPLQHLTDTQVRHTAGHGSLCPDCALQGKA